MCFGPTNMPERGHSSNCTAGCCPLQKGQRDKLIPHFFLTAYMVLQSTASCVHCIGAGSQHVRS